MLNITMKLIEFFENGSYQKKLINTYCNLIYKYGDLEDSKALLVKFIENPSEYDRILLLGPIMKHGNLEVAEQLFNECIDGSVIKELYPSEILHCLGYMGYTLIKPSLLKYMKTGNYDENKYACLGLLHFDCEEYSKEIKEEIEKCYNKNIFNEFTPSIASKIREVKLKEQIYNLGITTASTDCNAGILLGISLYKDVELFKKIIWNPHWEADSSGTGTEYWAFICIQYLEISFKELFNDVKRAISEVRSNKEIKYMIEMLVVLLQRKINTVQMPIKHMPDSIENFESIYESLFEWSNPNVDDSLLGITYMVIKDYELYEKLCNIRETLRQRVEQEIIEMLLVKENYI